MRRAAVIIGVNKTGGLPTLRDAVAGAKRMAEWARLPEQQIDPVELITDEERPVTVATIKDAIRDIVNADKYDQLIVYFAGHGVNNNRNEYWLLSDAPEDSNAAVNLLGSAKLAEDCGIRHVVLVSDACRTASQGTQRQSVVGSEIFPNRAPAGPSMEVDQFFACLLGDPAHEVKDKDITTAEYSALYTNALLETLRDTNAYEWPAGLLRPWPLRRRLESAIPEKLRNLNLHTKVIQVPDAKLTSDPATAWIARVNPPPRSPAGAAPATPKPGSPTPKPGLPTRPTDTATIAASMVRSAIAGRDVLEESVVFSVDVEPSDTEVRMARSAELLAQPFGPTHHETGCGFKTRGARIIEFYSGDHVGVEFASGNGDDLRIHTHNSPGGTVLMVLEGGRGVALPAIPGFMGALTFDDGELVDVAYEPSDTDWRWGAFEARHEEIRQLRGTAAAATRDGVFRLDGADALAVAQRMQLNKGVDPSLAVYAAYAYSDLRKRDLLHQMSDYMRGDLGARLFDLALLAREIDGTTTGTDDNVFGFGPLMAQGWALMSAYEVALPAALQGLERMLVPSVWTMFNAEGTDLIRRAVTTGAIR